MEDHFKYRLLFLTVYFIGFFSFSQASGRITIRIVRYRHSDDTLINGEPCDTLRGRKTSSCDPRISVCIGRMMSTCDLLKVSKRAMKDTKRFDFTKSLSSAPTFSLHQNILPTFFFVSVTIKDYDVNSAPYETIATFHTSISPNIGKTSDYDIMSEDNSDIEALEIQVASRCDRHFYGKRCEIRCRPRSHNQYCTQAGQLQCRRGWYGSDCSYQTCFAANPCQNGGKCRESSRGKVCICQPGFKGRHCEFENPCNSSPCKNGATCTWTDNRQRYQCFCPRNFNGSHCHQFTPCLSNPCLNGGDCKVAALGMSLWSCDCRPGYNQPQCELPDLCRTSPCQNGGSCLTIVKDGIAQIECHCLSRFSGARCEKLLANCRNLNCYNGGKCVKKNEFTMYCHCSEGFQGRHCEFDLKRKMNTSETLALRNEDGPSALMDQDRIVNAGRQVLNTAVNVVLAISGVCLFALIVSVVVITRRRRKRGWVQSSQDKLMQGSQRTEDGCSISNRSGPLPIPGDNLEGTIIHHEAEEQINHFLNAGEEGVQYAML